MHRVRALYVLAVLIAAPSAMAGTITVPGNYPSIQKAIDAAVNGDVIVVGGGTWKENIDLKGKAITLQGKGRKKTILDGSKGGPCITMASGETSSTVIDGFSIKFGTGKLINGLRYGGGVYISGKSSPTIQGDTAIGFNTANVGAGIFIDVGCNPLLQDVLIANNVTANKGVGAGVNSLGNPTFDNCRIAENTATNGTGGGVYLVNNTSSLSGNQFDKNHAFYGGGLLVNGGAPSITGNLFEENEVVVAPLNGEAGGIGIVGGSKALVTNNEFRLNSAHSGAGVYVFDATPSIAGNLVHDNTAATNSSGGFGIGGGMSLGKFDGTATLNEVFFNVGTLGGGVATRGGTTGVLYGNLIDHNDAASSGAGVGGGVWSKDSSPILLANTLANNAASDGGGLYVIGTAAPTVDTSIIWGNTAGSNVSFFDGTGLLVISFSDVEAATVGGSSLSIDPAFVNAASRNYRLASGSPVVDAGNFSFGGSGNDVYGNIRVVGGRIDMGAAEQ
jgi:parallel beta-helix repeat protein